MLPLERVDDLRRRSYGQSLRPRQSVDARQNLSALAGKARTDNGVFLVAHDALAERLAIHVLHEETGAQAILRSQHIEHARRWNALRVRSRYQVSLKFDRNCQFAALALFWCVAQD